MIVVLLGVILATAFVPRIFGSDLGDENDLVPPTITITRQDRYLSVNADDVDNDSWQYFRSSDYVYCDPTAGPSFLPASRANTNVSLSAVDNDHWFCFRVAGTNGVYGYANIFIDYFTVLPVVTVEQDGNAITATANKAVSSWRHRIIDVGDSCSEETFSFVPDAFISPPDIGRVIQSSNRLVIPDSSELQDGYRNRFVCFEAATTDGSNRRVYEIKRIDLGHPSITVEKELEAGNRYLRFGSDEDVVFRVGWIIPFEGGGFGGVITAGSFCDRLFILGRVSVHDGFAEEVVTLPEPPASRLVVPDEGRIYDRVYCVEATDADGNQTYRYVDALHDEIRVSQWRDESYAYVVGVAGDAVWTVAGPANQAACDADNFTGTNNVTINYGPYPEQYISSDFIAYQRTYSVQYLSNNRFATVELDSLDHGKYYCFRATAGSPARNYYKSIKVDFAAPLVVDFSAQVFTLPSLISTGVLTVSFDERIRGLSITGPVSSAEVPDCETEGVFDPNSEFYYRGHYNYYADAGTQTQFQINFNPVADKGKRYCFSVRDRVGNRTISEYLIDDQSARAY